jgi:hypothetical protein
VSGRKQITVTRAYQPVLEDCTRALEFLLTASVRTKEGGHATAPDDAKKEVKHVGARTSIHE